MLPLWAVQPPKVKVCGLTRLEDAQLAAELGELVRGLRAGRTAPGDITLFKSVGTALEDLAAAQAVLDAAERG